MIFGENNVTGLRKMEVKKIEVKDTGANGHTSKMCDHWVARSFEWPLKPGHDDGRRTAYNKGFGAMAA